MSNAHFPLVNNFAPWIKYAFFLIILILVLFIIYNIIIYKYFRNNGNISYDILLTNFIHNVSENNYFMNYGLWDNNNDSLLKANENLVNFVFDKSKLLNKKDLNILDVGCGYGDQDLIWSKKLDPSCKLTAIDISDKQISFAKQKNSTIIFDICDAMLIDKKYKSSSFDTIISLESAFHYSDRPKFLNNVNTLLKDNGTFIITDIMLKSDNSYKSSITTNIFIKLFSDFLHIPSQNLISSDEWEKQMLSEFNIIESYDITEQTFKPYYNHFMREYIKYLNLPCIFSEMLANFFNSVQPFSYRVAVLNKRMDNIV